MRSLIRRPQRGILAAMPAQRKSGTQRARRAASEKAILDAFEGLFKRHGAHGVGVNAVLGSAGVGKRLLYEYFGDLEGLASAWARERIDPLALGARRDELEKQVGEMTPARRTTAINADYGTQLKNHAWAAQVLLAELQQPNNVTQALRQVRRHMGDDYEGLALDRIPREDRVAMAVAFVTHAAAIYLALRAKFAPDYNGLDLGTDEGWDAALSMLDTVAEAVDAGAQKMNGAARPRKRRSV